MVAGREKSEFLFIRHGVIRKKGVEAQTMTYNGVEVVLSLYEKELLLFLVEHRGATTSYDAINEAMWSEVPTAVTRIKNTLNQLRAKFKAHGLATITINRGGDVSFDLGPDETLEASPLPEDLTREGGVDDRWRKDDCQSPLANALEVSEVEPLTFHELRHTYASGLVNGGCPLSFVAAQLGHADTRMVEKHYGHLCKTAKREAILKYSPVLGISTAKPLSARRLAMAILAGRMPQMSV